MNETFNLTRFFLLLRKHLSENHMRYLMSAVMAAGVLTFFFTIAAGSGYGNRFQELILQGGLITGGVVFSSMLFRDMSHRTHGIISLTLPASHLEKFLCAWFYGVIVFLPAYFFVFYSVDIVAVNIANTYQDFDTEIYWPDKRFIGNILIVFFIAQSVAMLGSIAFKRLHFVQTAFLAFIVIFILLRLDHFLAGWLISRDDHSGSAFFGGVWFLESESRAFLPVPERSLRVMELISFLLPLLFWLTTYFKLKEKQL